MTKLETFLRIRDVVRTTGLPRSTLYDLIDRHAFPRPIRLSARNVGWSAAEIAAWQAERIAERDGKAA